MPRYFVCETGPMGGVSVVFVTGTIEEARRWVRQNRAKRARELFIYQLVEDQS